MIPLINVGHFCKQAANQPTVKLDLKVPQFDLQLKIEISSNQKWNESKIAQYIFLMGWLGAR